MEVTVEIFIVKCQVAFPVSNFLMWRKKVHLLMLQINIGVLSLSPCYVDKVWELLKEILPEFKLSDEPNSENKMMLTDAKVKEAGKEVKDAKDFKPEISFTALKGPEKNDKSFKG